MDLPSLPRRKLEAERLHYCTAQERTAYSAAVNSQVSLQDTEAYPAGCAQAKCNCSHAPPLDCFALSCNGFEG